VILGRRDERAVQEREDREECERGEHTAGSAEPGRTILEESERDADRTDREQDQAKDEEDGDDWAVHVDRRRDQLAEPGEPAGDCCIREQALEVHAADGTAVRVVCRLSPDVIFSTSCGVRWMRSGADEARARIEYLRWMKRRLPLSLIEQPARRDAVLAVLLAAFVEWEILTSDVDGPLAGLIVLGLTATLPLALRRRWPVPVLAAVVLGVIGLSEVSVEQEPQSTLLAVLVASFSAGAYAPRRIALVGLAIALGGMLADEPGDFVVMGPVLVGTWLVGRLVRAHGLQAARLAELTRVLEREQADNARLAIERERVRIARELHDVVAHSVSVMVVQAGAERMTLGDDRPATRDALLAIERTGREALVEMRRLVGVLRRGDERPELAPQPSLARVEDLIDHVRRAGLPVELTVEGRAGGLPPGVDVSAFRIVQEALTNALKYAGRAPTTVAIRYGGRSLEIEIVDQGSSDAPRNGGGHGLIGMRERIAVYGGELEAGRRAGGGFAVRATIPIERVSA
jgi:signal transduction histidine kinase